MTAPLNGHAAKHHHDPPRRAAEDERVTFMDCPFDLVTMNEAVNRTVSWCREERRPHTVVTVNAGILVMMHDDEALASACRKGDLIVPDGVPVVWASHLVGTALRARVAGVDLMAALLERGGRERLSVFFLGAKEEVIQTLVGLCAERYPGLRVAGHRNGYFKEADHPAIIEQIRTSGADMLFVGMPSPFKELWCEQYRDALGVPVIMGVGGSFDVLAGFIKRAPVFAQKAGLEWFWRFLMEPRKMWKRYLVTNSLFIGRVVKDTVKNRLLSRSA